MSQLRELAYRVDPALWVREVLEVQPTPWQQAFLRAPRGSSILALTARQCGKTTTAAWGMAHAALFARDRCQRGRLPGTAPERGSSAAGSRMPS